MDLIEAISSLGDFQDDDSGAPGLGKQCILGVCGWTKIETHETMPSRIPIHIIETRIALGETSFLLQRTGTIGAIWWLSYCLNQDGHILVRKCLVVVVFIFFTIIQCGLTASASQDPESARYLLLADPATLEWGDCGPWTEY